MDELDRRRRRRLLEIAPRFVNDVPAVQLMDELTCITSASTREQIRNRERLDSRADANRLLCSSLTGRTGWYDQLLMGLDAVDCEEIANMMKTDSEGNSLLSDRPSSSPTVSSVNSRRVVNSLPADAPHWNQRQNVRATAPSVPGERQHISRNTTVIHFPIGVKKALSVLDLPNEGGLSNNWETLAGLLDVTWEESNWLERCPNPTSRIINAWYEKHPDHATLGNLLQMLEEMNRPDIISEIRKVIGWEEGGVPDESDSSVYRPVHDPDQIYRNLEKRPQYNNNLFAGERTGFNMEKPTRSLPLDLKDQRQQLEKFQTDSVLEGSSFRDGKELSKKMNNQPLDPPGTSAMSSSLLDKSQKGHTNNQDFPGKKVVDLSKEIQGAPPQDRLHPGYDFGKKGLHEGKVKGKKSEFTDKSVPSDWPKKGERMERSNLSHPMNQTGELFGNEPQGGLVRRKPMNDFSRSNEAGNGKLLEKPSQIPSPEETSRVNVESRKDMLDNRPKTPESGTKSKTTHKGEVSVLDKVRQAENGQNDLEMKSPECQPDERTLNPNMMTADSRRGTESKNYTLSQKKQMYHRRKQILKELELPSQMASMPAENSFGDTPVQHDMSDSPAHTLRSFESLKISASDILESPEESLNDGEPAKLTTVVKDSCNKEKLEDGDRKEINCSPRLEEGISPVATKMVNKSPPANASQRMPQESKKDAGEETCNGQGRQKLGSDCQADKPKVKMEQGKDDGKGRVEMEHYHKGFHGESQGIHGESQGIHVESQGFHGDNKDRRNVEDCAEAMGGGNVKSNSSKENVLITHDFTYVFDGSHTEMGQGMTRPTVFTVADQGINNLVQHGELELGSASKNHQLISKDFTMLERKPLEDRDEVKDDNLVEKEEQIQQRDEEEEKVGGSDGAHSLPSVNQSQEVGETSATPKPLRSEEPERSEVSALTTLVTGMASSVFRSFFGNNQSSS